MRIIDLNPKWLYHNGQRVGFSFVSPINPKWRQSCFAVSGFDTSTQWDIFGDDADHPQGCKKSIAWTIEGGINNADFATITVTPSLDGSAGGLWHGCITNGNILGGI